MAINGEIKRPPVGRFSWPLSSGVRPREAKAGAQKARDKRLNDGGLLPNPADGPRIGGASRSAEVLPPKPLGSSHYRGSLRHSSTG